MYLPSLFFIWHEKRQISFFTFITLLCLHLWPTLISSTLANTQMKRVLLIFCLVSHVIILKIHTILRYFMSNICNGTIQFWINLILRKKHKTDEYRAVSYARRPKCATIIMSWAKTCTKSHPLLILRSNNSIKPLRVKSLRLGVKSTVVQTKLIKK